MNPKRLIIKEIQKRVDNFNNKYIIGGRGQGHGTRRRLGLN
jgi:hypothetical protein